MKQCLPQRFLILKFNTGCVLKFLNERICDGQKLRIGAVQIFPGKTGQPGAEKVEAQIDLFVSGQGTKKA